MSSTKSRKPALRAGWIAAVGYWIVMGALIVSAIAHPSDPHHHRFARNLGVIALVGFLVLGGVWKAIGALMRAPLAEEIPDEPSS